MSWYKIRYNKRSAKKYGWDPFWFSATTYDEYLIENIKAFQRDHDLKVDGLCGPATYRRAFTHLENRITRPTKEGITKTTFNHIFCDGMGIRIPWDKVKIDFIKAGCYKKVYSPRNPTMVVTHWDAALSAKSCKNILEARKISTHFVIDNDGTIVQLLDTNHIGWHAGIRKVNNVSIGIDFSNAVYTKYNKTYERRGFGKRPIVEDWRVHGRKIKPFLGFYPVQIEAYKVLLQAIHDRYSIPLACPVDETGKLITTVVPDARKGKYEGIVNHYNLTKGKWDTSGLELDKIIQEMKTN